MLVCMCIIFFPEFQNIIYITIYIYIKGEALTLLRRESLSTSQSICHAKVIYSTPGQVEYASGKSFKGVIDKGHSQIMS